ncbi:MAG: hypothetical protein HYX89_04680 [Chloroflexi bacterium]|nr:hypothetical protein [Chloroflexota bacterium]
MDRGGAAASIGRWGLAEVERLLALWHRFKDGEMDRKALQRKLVPLQARMGRLLVLGEACGDPKAAALCREINRWWEALWTFTRVEGVVPIPGEPARRMMDHLRGRAWGRHPRSWR